MNRNNDTELRTRAEKVVPGGMYGHEATILLPSSFPQYFVRGEGAYIIDADDNRYLDFMCAYGPNLLGYGEARVAEAARRQLELGDTLTGPSPLMVELAETLVSMVSHAEWAMFCKNGTDATTMAKSVARAQSGKRKILVAKGAYHGAAPWCTPLPFGTIPEDRAHQIEYIYNDCDSLEKAVAEAGDDLAGIFATPIKHDSFVDQELPDPAYAKRARELCDASGAKLIVDEVRAGFRMARDSSWTLVGVQPDLSAWGKCFANGHPISALLGSENCREGARSIYATGSFWFSAVPMAAALETLKIIRESDYLEHCVALGERLRAGLDDAAKKNGFGLRQTGPVQIPLIMFEDDPDLRLGYGWVEEMLARGVYMHPWHNMFLCAAMTEADIDFAIDAAEQSFAALKVRRSSLEPHPVLMSLRNMLGQA